MEPTQQQPLHIMLLGAPYVGKGTIGKNICEAYGIQHISTGDIFRECAKAARQHQEGRALTITQRDYLCLIDLDLNAASAKAIEYERRMDNKEFIADKDVLGIVEKRILWPDCKNGILFDGFPRTIPQAEALKQILESQERKLDKVIALETHDEELLSRWNARLWAGVKDAITNPHHDKRSDDNSEAGAKKRIADYHVKTAPLIEYYQNQHLLTKVDATPDVETVTRSVVRRINSAIGRANPALMVDQLLRDSKCAPGSPGWNADFRSRLIRQLDKTDGASRGDFN